MLFNNYRYFKVRELIKVGHAKLITVFLAFFIILILSRSLSPTDVVETLDNSMETGNYLENFINAQTKPQNKPFIQESAKETVDEFQEFRTCQKFTESFPCMDILKRMVDFDKRAFWFNRTRQVDQRHLQVDFVNKELGLSFDRRFPNLKISKYFVEALEDDHRDKRYFKVGDEVDREIELAGIYRTWSYFASDNNIQEWWIAHGNLLAWSWNSLVFPWGKGYIIIFRL